MMTREQVENHCDVMGEVSIDWLVRVALARALRDHDAQQREEIEALRQDLEQQIDTGIKVVVQRDEMEAKREQGYANTTEALMNLQQQLAAWEARGKEVEQLLQECRTLAAHVVKFPYGHNANGCVEYREEIKSEARCVLGKLGGVI